VEILMSPTQRTLEALRERGYFAEVVERWNPHAGIPLNLYRWIDIVAVKVGEPFLAVQATSGPNAAARIEEGGGTLPSRTGFELAGSSWCSPGQSISDGSPRADGRSGPPGISGSFKSL
jgi:hypothetical protein